MNQNQKEAYPSDVGLTREELCEAYEIAKIKLSKHLNGEFTGKINNTHVAEYIGLDRHPSIISHVTTGGATSHRTTWLIVKFIYEMDPDLLPEETKSLIKSRENITNHNMGSAV